MNENKNLYDTQRKTIHNFTTKISLPISHRKHKPDPDLDAVVGDGSKSSLLDSSAQKHKLSVKPKKRHASSAQKKLNPKPGER